MRKKSRILLCLAALGACLLIGGCEMTQGSESGGASEEGASSQMEMSDGIELAYNKWTDSYSVVGIGTCTDTEIKLSGTYEGKKVTEIQASAFTGNRSITRVEIDEGIEKINEQAFARCTYLIQVTLGKNVSHIGANAFNECYNLLELCNNSALEIELGSNKNGKIAAYAEALVEDNQFSRLERAEDFLYFHGDDGVLLVGYFGQDTTMELPIYTSSYAVSEYAFHGTSVKNFRIASGTTDFTFLSKLDLEGVYYQGDLQAWCSLTWASGEGNPLASGARLFVENDTLVEGTVSIDFNVQAYALYQYAHIQTLTLTENCKSVGAHAFRGCANLENVVIEDNGITVLPEGVFADCVALESVDLGNSITQIGAEALYRAVALKAITLPSLLNEIGYRAFYKAEALAEIVIPAAVQTVGVESFAYCSKLAKLEMQEGLKTIDTSAFCYCIELQTVTIPDSVTTLGEGTFRNCSELQFVYIGDNVTAIPFRTFYGSGKVATIIMGNKVKHIGNYSIYAGWTRDNPTIIYFKGTETEYKAIRKEDILLNNANGNREILYYSATQPSGSTASQYWYFDQANTPTRWA